MTANEIRDSFKKYFESKQHAIVPSAPMVIKDDPTLMFTNAGMNQWKDIILGTRDPEPRRRADTQKCLRVSGKHNDLEEVGHDTYHHTMFEMLGNWSFGDYFKEGAIDMAWEYLVDVLKLNPEDLYVTVFEGSPEENIPRDDEAAQYWAKHVPEDHIINGNKHDNFWEMGDTGPCGPCSEIHVDSRTPEQRKASGKTGRELVNKDDPQVIEIWNLVFMQFNRKADGSLEKLSMNVIDTGMGFERLVRMLQGKHSNYDTDVFQPIIKAEQQITGLKYYTFEEETVNPVSKEQDDINVAMRVCADHLRAVSFSIADGQLPSNAKAGYVIRRILRRAVRYAYTFLGQKEGFLYKLLPTLVAEMGDAFPELKAQQQLIAKVNSGRLCVMFPEGRMTTNGNIMKIYEGAGLLADKTNSPVIPIWINGLQYCHFSRTRGRLPHRYFPKVKIVVDAPRPLKLKDELRHQRNHISNEIYMIMREQAFEAMYNPQLTVFTQLIKAAKIHAKKAFGFKRPKVLEDITRKPKSFKDIMLASYVLGRHFNKGAALQESIAIMLPNSVAAICTFFGLNAYGQVPVMLNFSAGIKNILSGLKSTVCKKVITSKMFVKKAGLEEVVDAIKENGFEVCYLEEEAKKISIAAKLLAFLQYKVKYVPYKATPDDRAVILFTSGSEGAPKAVVLSNRNVISNVWQIATFETVNRTDVILNSMPIFHSFGLVLGTLYALYQGAKVFLYPSPLHFRVISDLLYELGATVMIGTDTFFRSYAKIAHPLDFCSLRLVYAGAEGVKLDTRNLLNERLGVRLMECYGTTECSPAVAGNNMVFNKFGTIGKLCPGMKCRLDKVDGIENGGELVVKGPNVMSGYIMADNPGVLVPPEDGWYHTGDVVEIDEIGFISIKDRIKNHDQ